MLYFICVWIGLLLGCGIIGLALLHRSQVKVIERRGDRIILALWLGVIALSNTLLLLSLITPLTPLTGLGVILGLSAVSLLSTPTRVELNRIRATLSPALVLRLLLLALPIAALTTGQVTWFDTGLYHYQSIQYLARFGTVPGTALVLSNLGFTSSWFALAAPLNAAVLETRVSAVTNGFAVLLAAIHLWISLGHCINRRAFLSDWFALAFWGLLLCLGLGLQSLSKIFVSPSPDVPCILLTGVTTWLILICSAPAVRSPRQPIRGEPSILALLLAAGAMTLKLVAFPLLLITGLFYLIRHRYNFYAILKGSLATGLLLSPLLLASLMTSGCPLFPSALFCVDLPWSLDQATIQDVSNSTHNPTTWNDWGPTEQPSWFEALQQWFSSNPSRQFLPISIGLSLGCAAIIIALRFLSRRSPGEGQIWVTAVGLSGMAFLLLMSPFFRFLVPYILISPALLLAVVLRQKWDKHFPQPRPRDSLRSQLLSGFKLTLPLALVMLVVSINLAGSNQRLILPPPLRSVPALQQQVNGIIYFSPQQNLCWATELPCAGMISSDVYLRQPEHGIGGGFIRARVPL